MKKQLLIKAAKIAEYCKKTPSSATVILEDLQGQQGYLFAALSIDGHEKQAEQAMIIITDELKRSVNTFVAAHGQHRFEQLLESINERLHKATLNDDWNLPANKVNGIIGVVSDENMHLTGVGEMSVVYLHKTENQRYQIYNLSHSIKSEQTNAEWTKLFAVLLDGDLHAGDVFCISDRSLQQDIPPEEFNAILANLPPQSSTSKIRQYFPIELDFLLLVMKVQSIETEQTGPATLMNDSIAQFDSTTVKTQRILEDQKPRVLSFVSLLLKKFWGAEKLVLKSRSLRSLQRLIFSGVRVAFLLVIHLVKWFIDLVRDIAGDGRKERLGSVRRNIDLNLSSILGHFNTLPKTSKYLVLASVLLIFILISSVLFLSGAQTRQVEQENYSSSIIEIEALQEKASGALIYKDESQAREYLSQATTLILEIPHTTPEEQEIFDRLTAQNEVTLNELRHIITIPEPPLLGDISTVSEGLMTEVLVQGSNGVFVLASDTNAYRLNKELKRFISGTTKADSVGVAKASSAENDLIYYLDDRPGLSLYDAETQTYTATPIQPENEERWVDLYTYGGRVYILYPGGNKDESQILRVQTGGGKFSAPTNWIKAKSSDLTDAVSLAVDGTVFVLKQDGTIIRFTSGSEVGWDQKPVDPQLTAATDIWTDADSDYLYVLEPSTQRLVVFAKESGNFLVQYRSDMFVGLTDMLIDEAKKAIYLLAGGRVYQINATHIN